MTSLQIGIKPINIEDVLINNKIKYNTNNHWINKIKPVDYEDIIAMMHTKYWIDCFRDTYAVININASELSWMRECAKIGETTIKFSHLFDEWLHHKSELKSCELVEHETRSILLFLHSLLKSCCDIIFYLKFMNCNEKFLKKLRNFKRKI